MGSGEISMLRTPDTFQDSTDRTLLMRYLLGDLNEKEQGHVEERYFRDNQFHTKLLVTEDELIDSYLTNELSVYDRDRFEQAYLTNPARLRKVELSRSLMEVIANGAPYDVSLRERFLTALKGVVTSRYAFVKYSFAVLLLAGVLCGLIVWLIAEKRRIRGELERTRLEAQQKENEYLRQIAALRQSPSEKPTPDRIKQPVVVDDGGKGNQRHANSSRDEIGKSPPVVAFMVQPGLLLRGGGERNSFKPLILTRGAVMVRLKIILESNEYPSYSITLQAVGGRDVWRQTKSRTRQEVQKNLIEADVPATFFQTGDYILEVTGSNPPGEEKIVAFHQITAINHNRSREPKLDRLQR